MCACHTEEMLLVATMVQWLARFAHIGEGQFEIPGHEEARWDCLLKNAVTPPHPTDMN